MMAMTMSPADHVDMDSKESQCLYCGRHLESSEIAGSKASARPPPHVHHPTSRSSRFERRMSKSIKLLEGQNYSYSPLRWP